MAAIVFSFAAHTNYKPHTQQALAKLLRGGFGYQEEVTIISVPLLAPWRDSRETRGPRARTVPNGIETDEGSLWHRAHNGYSSATLRDWTNKCTMGGLCALILDKQIHNGRSLCSDLECFMGSFGVCVCVSYRRVRRKPVQARAAWGQLK